jgi:hypothetical protein
MPSKRFKIFHGSSIHNPSPWAAYAFHPLEAIIEVGLSRFSFTIPIHSLHLPVFFCYL